MSPPKPIATNLINIPRILTPVSYRDWLFNLMKTAHNRKALSRLAKEDLDQCFRLQATKQFELDNNNLKDALAQIQEGIGKTVWDNENRHRRVEPAEDLQELSLPHLVVDRSRELKEFWTVQTYQKFAESLERKNPNTVLTKETVDSAFRMVVSRMNGKKVSWKGRESAIIRILGKESTKYWKER